MNESTERRIVFLHRRGPWAGLYEIVGTTEDYLSAGEVIPDKEEEFHARPDNRLTYAFRTRTEPYVLFEEGL